MEKDLTIGDPFKVIVLFSLPIIGGNLFQLLYTLADTVIVGQVLGSDAPAAVGSSFIWCFALCRALLADLGSALVTSLEEGMGNSKAPFCACMAELVIRICATTLLAGKIGYVGICLATPLAWMGAIAVLTPQYHKCYTGSR